MEIDVYRTHVVLKPYNSQTRFVDLERTFCIKDKYFRYIPIGLYLDKDKQELRLPRSVNVHELENVYNECANIHKGYDDYNKLIIKLKYEPRDENQRKAIAFLLGKEEYENNSSYAQKILELDTSMGKTFCAVAAISYLKMRAGIIVNKNLLIKQWISRITEYTNLSEKEIFVIQGAKKIEKVLNDECKKVKIFLISHETITHYANRNGWDSVTELFKKMKIGVKVFDEAHESFANIVKIDLFTNTRYTYYLSATAERSDYKENRLYKKVFGKVPTLSIHRSKKEAYVRGIVLKYETKPNYTDLAMIKNSYGMNINGYMNYMVYGKGEYYFFKAIRSIINTYSSNEEQIVFLLSRKKILKYVKEYIKKVFPDIKVGILDSDVKGDELRKKQMKKKIILTTFKTFGTGIDIDTVTTMVMCEPYSSKKTLKQALGRLRWTEDNKILTYIELVDIGIELRKRQFNKIEKTLLSLCTKVKSFEIK